MRSTGKKLARNIKGIGDEGVEGDPHSRRPVD
jgi:hypothetical protein